MYLVNPNKSFQSLEKEAFFSNDFEVGKDLFRLGRMGYEQEVIAWCAKNYGNKQKMFIDIGAHVGSYAWSLAPYFKNVVAFEPNREVYNCLCANNFLKGQSKNIVTHCNGISDTSEIKTYHVRCDDGGGNGFAETELDDNQKVGKTLETFELEVRTLDSYNFDNVGFIKIDVEGHEEEVIDGAIETIKRCGHPPIIFESWEPGMHPNLSYDYTLKLRENLFKKFQSIGYKIVPVGGWKEMYVAVKAITKEEEIKNGFERQPLDYWINSIGGCRTNFITDEFEKTYKVKNDVWHKLACHYTKPFHTNVKGNIFCFVDDIGIAMTSQINQRTIDINNFEAFYGVEWSIGNWIEILEKQIHAWARDKHTYLINTDYLEEEKKSIESHFGIKIGPIKKRNSKVYHKELLPYLSSIERINQHLQSLPHFKIKTI